MGGITVDDFTSSVAYREIFGLGQQEGEQKGRLQGRQEGLQEGRQAVATAPFPSACTSSAAAL
ncbi:MAG: hypothetical protein RLZZ206_2835 [Cyanobacteriota bacterium]|jgi:predicted transposase YdaD